jgi:hypothetical protein
MAKGIMQTNHIQRKAYSYELNGVKLDFTLRQDVKAEMVAFKEMMTRAIKDIDQDLEKVVKK